MSLSSARDASAAERMTWSAEIPLTVNGSPRVSLFWVKVPVLSEQSTSTPASSSIAERRVTMASFFARRRAPTAIVTESTVGIATGIAATRRTSANSRVSNMGSPRKSATARINDDERDRENDEVVADLQHGALEVTDGVSLLNELRGLAEVTCSRRSRTPSRRSRPAS